MKLDAKRALQVGNASGEVDQPTTEELVAWGELMSRGETLDGRDVLCSSASASDELTTIEVMTAKRVGVLAAFAVSASPDQHRDG